MDLLDVALEGTAGWDRARAEQRAGQPGTTAAVLLRGRSRCGCTTRPRWWRRGEVRVRPDIYGLDEAYARAHGRRRRAASARPSRRASPACAEVRGHVPPAPAAAGRRAFGGAKWSARDGRPRPRRSRLRQRRRGAGPGGRRGRRAAPAGHPARADRRDLRRRLLERRPLRPRRAPPARLGVPRPVAGGSDADGPAPVRRAAHGCAAARCDGAVPGRQRLPRAGDQRGAGAGLAAGVARQPAHVGHGRGCAAAGARLHRAWRVWRRRCRWAASGFTAAMASCTWTAARPGAGRPRPGASAPSAARRAEHRGAGGGQGRAAAGRGRGRRRLPRFRA